jgi:hypothetical protein
MSRKKKGKSDHAQSLTSAELRAARSERVKVSEAKPYGWLACSESGSEQDYHLYLEPYTKRLVCTCADFIFRGNGEPGFECKHVSATLKFIARHYLVTEYDPFRQHSNAA